MKYKADSTLRASRAVPHPSTDRALCRLTAEVERDPVHSTRYGRQRKLSLRPRRGKLAHCGSRALHKGSGESRGRGVAGSRGRGVAASWRRGVAASRRRRVAASRRRGVAASWRRGIAASRRRGVAASRTHERFPTASVDLLCTRVGHRSHFGSRYNIGLLRSRKPFRSPAHHKFEARHAEHLKRYQALHHARSCAVMTARCTDAAMQ